MGNLRGAKLRGKSGVISARYWIISEAESARQVNRRQTRLPNHRYQQVVFDL